MRPPRPSHSQPLLVPALLFGLVWQIGSCPCGCLDHNLWSEMYESLGGTKVVKQKVAGGAIEGHDCEHRPRDSFLRGRTIGEAGEACSPPPQRAPFLYLTRAAADASSASACDVSRGSQPVRFSDAQEMRAHLQVFRI